MKRRKAGLRVKKIPRRQYDEDSNEQSLMKWRKTGLSKTLLPRRKQDENSNEQYLMKWRKAGWRVARYFHVVNMTKIQTNSLQWSDEKLVWE